MAKRLIFLLGGARSGKSAFAENWARENGQQVLFVATAQAFDEEMCERITHHRAAASTGTRRKPRKRRCGTTSTAYDTLVLDCLTCSPQRAATAEAAEQADNAILAEVDLLLRAYEASKRNRLVVTMKSAWALCLPIA